MKMIIPVILLALLLLSGCATTRNRPHPYDRDSKQVKCEVCGQWYDGKPIKYGLPSPDDKGVHQGGCIIPENTCPECGRVMPAPDKAKDLEGLSKALDHAVLLGWGALGLLLAGFFALALG